MKQLITTIAAVLLLGCATTQQPEPPTAKAPDISIHDAASDGNIEAVKQHLAAGTAVDSIDSGRTPLWWAVLNGHKETAELIIAEGADVNVEDMDGKTPTDLALEAVFGTLFFDTPNLKAPKKETADLLRKHGGKTAEELKAEGK